MSACGRTTCDLRHWPRSKEATSWPLSTQQSDRAGRRSHRSCCGERFRWTSVTTASPTAILSDAKVAIISGCSSPPESSQLKPNERGRFIAAPPQPHQDAADSHDSAHPFPRASNTTLPSRCHTCAGKPPLHTPTCPCSIAVRSQPSMRSSVVSQVTRAFTGICLDSSRGHAREATRVLVIRTTIIVGLGRYRSQVLLRGRRDDASPSAIHPFSFRPFHATPLAQIINSIGNLQRALPPAWVPRAFRPLVRPAETAVECCSREIGALRIRQAASPLNTRRPRPRLRPPAPTPRAAHRPTGRRGRNSCGAPRRRGGRRRPRSRPAARLRPCCR